MYFEMYSQNMWDKRANLHNLITVEVDTDHRDFHITEIYVLSPNLPIRGW